MCLPAACDQPHASTRLRRQLPRRFFLPDELHNRGPGHPQTTFVCFICCDVREVLTDRLGVVSGGRGAGPALSPIYPDWRLRHMVASPHGQGLNAAGR